MRQAGAQALARIAYPGQGAVIALDPDIPPARQRVALQLSGTAGKGWRWHMDQEAASDAARPYLWLPAPGRHRLRLLDSAGRLLDQVEFDVRALKGRAGR